MDQKFFEWMNAFSRKKLLKHSHGVTQATYTVTQERDKRRYTLRQEGASKHKILAMWSGKDAAVA